MVSQRMGGIGEFRLLISLVRFQNFLEPVLIFSRWLLKCLFLRSFNCFFITVLRMFRERLVSRFRVRCHERRMEFQCCMIDFKELGILIEFDFGFVLGIDTFAASWIMFSNCINRSSISAGVLGVDFERSILLDICVLNRYQSALSKRINVFIVLL